MCQIHSIEHYATANTYTRVSTSTCTPPNSHIYIRTYMCAYVNRPRRKYRLLMHIYRSELWLDDNGATQF